MPDLPAVISALPGVPIPHLVIFVALSALALAAFTIHSVVSVVKERNK